VIFSLLLCGCLQGPGSFYETSAGNGAPGTIISVEPMHAPAGASAYRVLYRSTGPDGSPIAASGVIIVPGGEPPPGGRPIIAWAHPTTGVVPKCAPSLARFLFLQIQGLTEMLDRGYVVAATDYPGLGTPEPHPYLIGISEARAVIDSVRAARALPNAAAGDRFAVWGHSQGGQAVLFAGLIAKSYAPELHLVGVAAAAPATDLKTLLVDDIDTSGGRSLTAMTFYSWSKLYGISLKDVVEPQAMPTVNALSNECIESIFDMLEYSITERPLQKAFLVRKDFADIEPWKSLLAQNSAGPVPADVPVFLAQGTADGIVSPAVTKAYYRRLCKAGVQVRFDLLPGVSHVSVAKKSASDAIQWITGRFGGTTPPDDCSSL
jgi:acetyl esterase/lipase